MSTELNLSFSEATVTAIKIIAESESDDFSKLVHAANLDKRNDFIGASFSGMKLDSTELTGFNFTDADFRNCSLKSTKFIDCQLTGALFDFPPDIRNRWHRDRDFFIGDQNPDIVALMRTVSEASKKEHRKEAAEKLLNFKNDEEVVSFLQLTSLKDKAKSLRSWLRSKLSDSQKQKDKLEVILERSIFENGADLESDINQYLELTNNSIEAIEIVNQACTTNARVIKHAGEKLIKNEAFKRTLINNVAFSSSSQIWNQSALTLRNAEIDPLRREFAFNMRISRISDLYDLKSIAEAAAYNFVKNAKLFDICEKAYKSLDDGWQAGDLLFYCYFYDPDKYLNDVLFYSFFEEKEMDLDRKTISSRKAFKAFCFVHEPELFWNIEKERGYFYADPNSLIKGKKDYYEDRISPDLQNALKNLAEKMQNLVKNTSQTNLIRSEDISGKSQES